MLVAMSSSKCQDLVMEEVQNDQYILHIKLDLSSQEVNCFGDNISMSVFRDDPSFKDNLVTQALKHWALGKTLEFEKSSKPVFNYGQLFADPNSEEWTGNGVKLQLSSYLGEQGWGRNKPKKYGEGVPPVGYPEGPK
jgi:hypothetical protein